MKRRVGRATPHDYYQSLQRYRQQHPESLEEEQRQIQQWLLFVDRSKKTIQQAHREKLSVREHARVVEALFELCEVARAAFMSHPAATEYDFRRCWPNIRDELLKQHAVEELAANPERFRSLTTKTSEIQFARSQSQEFPGRNLQLLKKGSDSE